jgi:hypothetical protein
MLVACVCLDYQLYPKKTKLTHSPHAPAGSQQLFPDSEGRRRTKEYYMISSFLFEARQDLPLKETISIHQLIMYQQSAVCSEN